MRRLLAASVATLLAACGSSSAPGGGDPVAACKVGGTEENPPPIEHVFAIVLENKGFDETYGPGSPAPYLSTQLIHQGQLLTHFHGTSHASTGNYIAMISGQGPNLLTHGDCINFAPWNLLGLQGEAMVAEYAQAIGLGCIYPSNIPTLPDELELAGKTWHGWMEDMQHELKGSAARHPNRPAPGTPEASCIQPEASLVSIDQTNGSDETEQYAARHNPFVFFESIIGKEDTPEARRRCDDNVVDLERLRAALQSRSTTPNYNLIVPDNCRNAHDAQCADGGAGGLERADEFLKEWVPIITASPAFRESGLLVILFDEANINPADPEMSAACCGQAAHPGPNTLLPGLTGPGGGRFGALVLSPFTKPGTVNDTPYNHFSFLRTVENIFGLDTIDLDAKPDDGYLGYAGLPASEGMKAFGEDVYNCGS